MAISNFSCCKLCNKSRKGKKNNQRNINCYHLDVLNSVAYRASRNRLRSAYRKNSTNEEINQLTNFPTKKLVNTLTYQLTDSKPISI